MPGSACRHRRSIPSHVIRGTVPLQLILMLGAAALCAGAAWAVETPRAGAAPEAQVAPGAFGGEYDTLTLVLQPGAEGKDAGAFMTYPTTNYGDGEWYYAIGLPDRGAAYQWWDLSALPAGAEITSAVIALWGEYNNGNLYFAPVASPWDEMTVTWANQPSATTPTIEHPVARTTECYWGCAWPFDITDIVRGWAADPAGNHGLKIWGSTLPIGWMMASSDNKSYPKPVLTIRYIDMVAPARARTWGSLKALYR